MSYLEFHLLFNLPVLLLLFWLARPRLTRSHIKWIGVVLLIVLLFATPWDGWAVYKKFWEFNNSRVLFRVGVLPIEEILFFFFVTLEASLLTILFLPRAQTQRA